MAKSLMFFGELAGLVPQEFFIGQAWQQITAAMFCQCRHKVCDSMYQAEVQLGFPAALCCVVVVSESMMLEPLAVDFLTVGHVDIPGLCWSFQLQL